MADDAGGAVMLAAIIGVVIGCALLWRAGAALIAFATAVLAFTFAGAADDYFQTTSNAWASESTWLLSAMAVALIGATLTPGHERLVVVNEVGFRHFAQSVGFPVVLIASGLTLFAVAGGLFGLLPRLRKSSGRPVS